MKAILFLPFRNLAWVNLVSFCYLVDGSLSANDFKGYFVLGIVTEFTPLFHWLLYLRLGQQPIQLFQISSVFEVVPPKGNVELK